MKRTKLKLRSETIRSLDVDLSRVRGGDAATAGDTGCLSEATGCPSRQQWSCMGYSCHNQGH